MRNLWTTNAAVTVLMAAMLAPLIMAAPSPLPARKRVGDWPADLHGLWAMRTKYNACYAAVLYPDGTYVASNTIKSPPAWRGNWVARHDRVEFVEWPLHNPSAEPMRFDAAMVRDDPNYRTYYLERFGRSEDE